MNNKAGWDSLIISNNLFALNSYSFMMVSASSSVQAKLDIHLIKLGWTEVNWESLALRYDLVQEAQGSKKPVWLLAIQFRIKL